MRSKSLQFVLPLVFCFVGPGMAQAPPSPSTSMTPVSRSKLCITEGEIKELPAKRLSVSVPKMRAFVTGPTLQEVEARFKYLGPSAESIPLASGEMRRQFGLKLRAQNACNLVYAMWRIEPRSELVVSVKRNPGMTRSAGCGAHGYHNIKPTRDINVPQVEAGKQYVLRAILDHGKMRVYANNQLVWEGLVGRDLAAFDGPVGVRTDNGSFDFELFAATPGPGQHGASANCRSGATEDE